MIDSIRLSLLLRFGALAIVLGLLGCSPDISVPVGKSLDGCYVGGGVTIILRDGVVFWSGSEVSTYKSGRDNSGSYILFKPAIHILSNGAVSTIIVKKELEQNYLSTIVELGNVTLLMPQEPLGQVKMIQRRCS